jgi:hypothetical protein
MERGRGLGAIPGRPRALRRVTRGRPSCAPSWPCPDARSLVSWVQRRLSPPPDRPQPEFFLPTVGFLPLGGGKGIYRGIPLNTARIQISNQNSLKPLIQTVSRGIPRYKLFLPRGNEFIPVQRKRPSGFE